MVSRVALELNDLCYLIDCVFPRQQSSATVKFIQETAQAPHIAFGGIGAASQEHFGCTVPSGSDKLGHERFIEVFRLQGAREPEIADLDLAAGVDEYVGGFEIAMEYSCRVEIFKSTGQLINDTFFMQLVQNSVFDCFEDVTLHEFEE